jgi:carotenoid cleavage dioxygenase
VLQAVRYPELWRNDGGFDAEGVLWTWTIDLQAGTVGERQLDDRFVECPRIDDRLAGLPARYSVSVGANSWVRHDLSTGEAVEHPMGVCGPGEAVFVPSARVRGRATVGDLGYAMTDPQWQRSGGSSMRPTSPESLRPRSSCQRGCRTDSTKLDRA